MSGMEAIALPALMGMVPGLAGGASAGISSLLGPMLGGTAAGMFGNVIGGSSSTAGADLLGGLGKNILSGGIQGGLQGGLGLLGGGGQQGSMGFPSVAPLPPLQMPEAAPLSSIGGGMGGYSAPGFEIGPPGATGSALTAPPPAPFMPATEFSLPPPPANFYFRHYR